MFSSTPWAPQARRFCQSATESVRTRFITSFINRDVVNRLLQVVDIRWHHTLARTSSISSSQRLLLQQLPTLQDNPCRSYSGKSRARYISRGYNQIRYDECEDIDEVLQLANKNLHDKFPIAAVWNIISRMSTRQNRHAATGGAVARDQVIHALLQHTMNKMGVKKPKELVTITLSMAKIFKNVQQAKQQRRMNAYQQSFDNVLVGNKEVIFNHCAKLANELMRSFDARHLSNLAYAFALLGQNPEVGDDRTLLHSIADQAIDHIEKFKPQELAILVWAFATLRMSHALLFQAVGDTVSRMTNLRSFDTQALANIVWAFPKANQQHDAVFGKIGNHIAEVSDLRLFSPQDLANIVWAYAAANKQHDSMFHKIGDHIAEMNDFRQFKPQALTNIVWAYATANQHHDALFGSIGDYIAEVGDLRLFKPQDLSNIAWAYATVNKHNLDIFRKIGDHIAEVGDLRLFKPQALANIAWAYAVVDLDLPKLFNNQFLYEILDRKSDFAAFELAQLYQWHLWQAYEKRKTGLSTELKDQNYGLAEAFREQCYEAFISPDSNISGLQDDVAYEFDSMGFNPIEEYLAPSGYSIDALIQVDDKPVGIEVDGPSHFIEQKPTARTLLKRRQIAAADKIPLISVPYWEWNELGKDQD